MVTIAVVAMGEMGSGIARRLVERGARVVTSLEGRSQSSIERARQAGVENVDVRELAEQAEIVLSIVPPKLAEATAGQFCSLFEGARNKPTFIDCNAIAPQTLKEISAKFIERGLPILDGSIAGLPPKPDGYSPRLYLSGPVTREVDLLRSLGIDTCLLSSSLGDASALKMAYAGITKGIQAIGTAMALGAARFGIAEHFLAEMKDTQPQIYAWLVKMLPSMYAKAYRWDDEMLEISKFLQPEEGASDMLRGAATLYRHVASENQIGPQSEIVSILNRFCSK